MTLCYISFSCTLSFTYTADTTEDGYLQAETNYTMAVDLDEDNCFGNFSDCLNRNRDWDNLKPFTETPEGRVAFDDDFFSRICQFVNISYS